MAENDSRKLSRRDLVKASAAGAAVAATASLAVPSIASAQDIPEIPRNRQLILRWGGVAGRHEDYELWSGYPQNAELWRLPVDPMTGEAMGMPEPVVVGARESTRGAWSPDGERIAFGSDRGGEMNLWLLSLRDGRTRRLTSGAGGDFQPNWSPDARSLLFFSARAGAIDIWRYDFDGQSLTRLTRGQALDINPFFSPDGRHIAFHSDRDGRFEVFVMNADGKDVRQLTSCGVTGHFLRWSADGTRIFFRCPSAATTMTVAVTGGEPEPVANVMGGAHMSFSPDHSRIMDVVAHRLLWCSPLDGTPPRKVFEFADAESRIDYPVWSPDGRWILFDRFMPQGGDVWAVEE